MKDIGDGTEKVAELTTEFDAFEKTAEVGSLCCHGVVIVV